MRTLYELDNDKFKVIIKYDEETKEYYFETWCNLGKTSTWTYYDKFSAILGLIDLVGEYAPIQIKKAKRCIMCGATILESQ